LSCKLIKEENSELDTEVETGYKNQIL
jgi:hypothetical protein